MNYLFSSPRFWFFAVVVATVAIFIVAMVITRKRATLNFSHFGIVIIGCEHVSELRSFAEEISESARKALSDLNAGPEPQ